MATTLIIIGIISEHGTTRYELAHAHLAVYASSEGDVALLMLIVPLAMRTLVQRLIKVVSFVTVSSS